MEQKQKENMPEKSVKIIVNGVEHDWGKESISYSEILRLAGYSLENGEKFDVQYVGGAGRGETSGILMYRDGSEESIKVKEGTSFTVQACIDA